MTVRAPRQKRPSAVDEIIRLGRIYRLLKSLVDESIPKDEPVTIDHHLQLFAIAERIAARTED